MDNFNMREPSEEDVKRAELKLVGKVYVDPVSPKNPNGKQTFSDADLTEYQQVRVLRPGQPMTYDLWPNRLNIHLNGDDECNSVDFG